MKSPSPRLRGKVAEGRKGGGIKTRVHPAWREIRPGRPGKPAHARLPIFGNRAVNAVIAGNVDRALLYAPVPVMWRTGAARRSPDTRPFTRTCTQSPCRPCWISAGGVVREFASSFEKHPPITATSLASIFAACIMLLAIAPWAGVLAVFILPVFLRFLPRFTAASERFCYRLNNRPEQDNHYIGVQEFQRGGCGSCGNSPRFCPAWRYPTVACGQGSAQSGRLTSTHSVTPLAEKAAKRCAMPSSSSHCASSRGWSGIRA